MQKTIFMIHGMWCGGWVWENFIHYFEKLGYRCIAPTLRHHNATKDDDPHPDLGTTSLIDYINDLEKEITALDAPPIIMGHSMGGLLTQMLGSRGLAGSLVLLSTAPPAGVFALKPTVLKSFFSSITTYGFWEKPIFPTFKEAVYSTLHLLPVDEQKENYEKFVYESGKAGFEIGFYLFDKKRAAKVDEKNVLCPMLVISGKKDRITPASVVKKTSAKYKQAEYREFEEFGHWVVGEPGWEKIAGCVADWLDKNSK